MKIPTYYDYRPWMVRDRAEFKRIYQTVIPKQKAFDEARYDLILRRLVAFADHWPYRVHAPIAEAVLGLLMQHAAFNPVPVLKFDAMTEAERDSCYWMMRAKEYFFEYRDELLDLIFEAVEASLSCFKTGVIGKRVAMSSPLLTPLEGLVPNLKDAMERICSVPSSGYTAYGILATLRDQLERNQVHAAGYDPDYQAFNSDTHLPPRRSNIPDEKLVDLYLAGTPFHALFKTPVPLAFPKGKRFEHTVIVAPPGQGKTSLIERLILHDLNDPYPPSLVILEPHADLIRRITEADCGIADRVVIIDPRDPPAINLFDVQRADNATDQEQIIKAALRTLTYAFSGILDTPLTGRQGIFFEYCVRLMFAMKPVTGKNATVADLLDLMQKDVPERFDNVIATMSATQQKFFRTDFVTAFSDTKQQMRYRLFGLLADTTFERLFTTEDSTLDFYALINQGAVILIDASEGFLQDSAGAFGRIFISLILQAVMARFVIPEEYRKSTFIYIDEAWLFFSEDIGSLLRECRKFKAGTILAFQDFSHASPTLLAALSGSTAIKIAGGSTDAARLAKDMHASPEFISSQPPFSFACHMRGLTPKPLTITVEPGAFDSLPKLSAEALAKIRGRSAVRPKPAPAAPTPAEPVADDEF